MLVCDNCKQIGRPTSRCYITLLKLQDIETKNLKKVEREIKRYPLDLCEECIKPILSMMGKFINMTKEPKRKLEDKFSKLEDQLTKIDPNPLTPIKEI